MLASHLSRSCRQSINRSLIFTTHSQIKKEKYGDDAPPLAVSYSNLGYSYAKKGNYDKAIELYDAAVRIDTKAHGENSLVRVVV